MPVELTADSKTAEACIAPPRYQSALEGAATVIWNGPMGVFEFEAFAAGTRGIAQSLASLTEQVSAHLFWGLGNAFQTNNIQQSRVR